MKSRAILKIHYTCNNKCNFCHCHNNKGKEGAHDIRHKIQEAKRLGADEILLSGGEPTINKNIFRMISAIREQGMSFGLVTNARMLSNIKFHERIFKDNPSYFYISLHSAKESVHDKMTGVEGSWRQTMQGIKNIRDRLEQGLIIVNCVITEDNVDQLTEQARLLAAEGIHRIKFSYPEWKGRMTENMDRLPNPRYAAVKIAEALDICEKEGKIGLYDGLPYCYMPERHRMKLDNLETNKIYYMSESFEEGFFRTDEGERIKADGCLRCSLHGICSGFHPNNNITVEPITRTIPEKIIITSRDDMRYDPATVGLIEEGKNLSYRYVGSFFKSYNVEKSKTMGSIVRYKPDTDSFLKNLKTLRLDKEKDAFDSDGSTFFDKAKEVLEKELSKVRGKVLDVGFGELSFHDSLRRYIEDKGTEYIGIDPDPKIVEHAKKRFPRYDFRRYDIEGFKRDNDGERFDAVLMLGCYDHFRHLEEAIHAGHELLKEGGKMIIMENNLLGVIGMDDSNEGHGMEHYRNHNLSEAEKIISSQGLKIAESEDKGIFWKIVVVR